MSVSVLHSGNGHRRRLRQRFLNGGLDGFLDYEIIELLLTLGTPRKDCKQTAKAAIKKFNGLLGVLNASEDELLQISGIGPTNSFGIKLFAQLNQRYAKEKLIPKLLLNSPQLIFNFLKEKIGSQKKEHFIIIFMDVRNNVIVDDISIGILDASLVHPREVFKSAILHTASHVVVAHNHPSGDPTPSEADLEITNRLVEAGTIIGIQVVDHLIIAHDSYISLKEQGFIH